MRRWLGWIAIAWLLALCAVALVTYGRPAASTSLDERARTLALQFRCPVCQGESVADSPSGIARSIRAIIRQRMARGESDDAIKGFLVSSYGNWILLAPPVSGIGSLAWFAPPLLLLLGIGFLATLVMDWRRRARQPVARPRQVYVDQVRAELAAESGTE